MSTESDVTTHALRLIRAADTLDHAVAYLYLCDDRWPRGEQEAARDAAVTLLRAHRRELLDMLRG